MNPLPHNRQREDGAVAVTVAIVLLLLFLITALIIDLGFTRADARGNQTHADFAVLAAAHTEGSAADQCRAAVRYFAANAPEVTTPVDDTACGLLPLICTSSTLPVTVGPMGAGPYELLVTHPVADGDAAMVIEGQAINDDRDGLPCDRIKTEVRRNRNYVFAPAAGLMSGGSFGDAVAIRTVGDAEDQFASLIVLEEVHCLALNATGGANIEVRRGTAADGSPIPGIITVDSLANGGQSSENCNTGGTKAIVGPASGYIEAADHIFSYGMRAGTPGNVYDPAHVPGRLRPEPEAGMKITRAPVDHRFNCRSTYPAPGQPQWPAASQEVGPCGDLGTRDAYIDELRAALQSTGTPAGFLAIGGNGTCPSISYNGLLATVSGVPIPHLGGNLRIRCNPGNSPDIDITNANYVIFDQHISGMNGGLLRVQGAPATGVAIYFRADRGGLAVNGGVVDFRDAFVYIDSDGSANPASHNQSAAFNGGDVTWLAPVSPTIRATCDSYGGTGLPPVGCFAPLGLWSNSRIEHAFAGNGSATVRGTFFSPNGDYVVAGGAAFDFTESQFFSQVLRVTGGGTLVLIPNPNTNIPIPLVGVGLIR